MTNAGPNPSPKLVLKGVNKRFNALEVLRNLSFEVVDHEFLAIVGPSGCGKTTLLRILAGTEKANSGDILLNGNAITGPGRDRGVVFQSDSLFPWRTVWRNVILGPELAHNLTPETRSYANSLLTLVGLQGFEKYYPSQLSGGMRQRVNLARALAIDPDVILMDEPFSALDSQMREMMQAELLRIWQNGRKTVIFITHQIEEAVFLSDRVAVLGRRPGRLREIISIDLPRPRVLAVKRTPEFVGYTDRIWRLIESDVIESFVEESSHGATAKSVDER